MDSLASAISRRGDLLSIPTIAILLVVVGCASPPVKPQPALSRGETPATAEFHPKSRPPTEASYPAWFWDMPDTEGALFAVGFSETYAHAETSEQGAIADGVENLAKVLSVRIKGGEGVQREGGRVVYYGNDLQEEVSADTLALVKENHQVVAKYASAQSTFVLLRFGRNVEDSRNGEASIHALPDAATSLSKQPRWVTALPSAPGYLYASGQSNPYYREANSWRAAEKHARIALALSLESKVRGLAKELETQMATISTVSTDVQLNRIQVVARWKHPVYHTCHVLVRMPLSANRAAVTSLVKSILPQAQAKPSPEEIIQRAFDELEQELRKGAATGQ